jgi:hypothetical protein
MIENHPPLWLVDALRRALLGAICPNVRLIAVRFGRDQELVLRFYLSSKVKDENLETAEEILGELDSSSQGDRFTSLDYELVESHLAVGHLDPLDFVMYARREESE